MAYKSYQKLFYNSEDFTVKSFNDKEICLINDLDKSEITIDIKQTNYFKPMYAITVYKAQGQNIDRPYSIYELKNETRYVICSASKSDKERVR